MPRVNPRFSAARFAMADGAGTTCRSVFSLPTITAALTHGMRREREDRAANCTAKQRRLPAESGAWNERHLSFAT